MSAAIISLLFALGAGAWLYTKFMRYSGNNTQQAAIATGVSSVIIFFVLYLILGLIL